MTEITEEQARVYKKLMKSFFISLKNIFASDSDTVVTILLFNNTL